MSSILGQYPELKEVLEKWGHIGESHEGNPQIHVEGNSEAELTDIQMIEAPCPSGCGRTFTPFKNIFAFHYGRRKTYMVSGCKGTDCHKSKGSRAFLVVAMNFVKKHGPKWRTRGNKANPGLKNEKYFPEGVDTNEEAVLS